MISNKIFFTAGAQITAGPIDENNEFKVGSNISQRIKSKQSNFN